MLGMTWLVLWLLVGREIPHRETVIPLTNDRGSSGGGAGAGGGAGGVKGRPAATPWRKMMVSPAVWAIVINNFSFHYAFYVIMNWMPTYFTRCGPDTSGPEQNRPHSGGLLRYQDIPHTILPPITLAASSRWTSQA